MAIWRMSFRAGNQGKKMWPICLELGVAAITYLPLSKIDLSAYPEQEPKELWSQLESTQKSSLKKLAYKMKPGDTIYVKEGPKIVSKGTVKGQYYFDTQFRIIDPNNTPWSHQIPVEWDADFTEVEILLGAEQLTVKELSSHDIAKLESKIIERKESFHQIEVTEGEIYKAEANFRSRNRALIQAKKVNSDYKCEVCGFNFEEMYGEIGCQYIIAHHLKPISTGPHVTTLDEISLICANCHSMAHTQNPPIPVEQLRSIITKNSRK